MTADQYITIGTSAATLVGTLTVVYFNQKITDRKVDKLTIHINSRMDKLLTLSGREAFLEGVKSETDKNK